MKTVDLMDTCLKNLFRHKSRTILTVLGVVVGCCSVVLMVSFGIAMEISTKAMLAEMGDLTCITVMPSGNTKLTAATVKNIQAIKNVSSVMPKKSDFRQSISITTADERYVLSYLNLTATDIEAAKEMGYKLTSGEFIDRSKGEIQVLFGAEAAYQFSDSYRPEGNNTVDYYEYYSKGDYENHPDPYFDPLKTELKLTVGGGSGSSDKPSTFNIKVVGIMKEDYAKGGETGYGIMMDSADLNAMLEQYNHDNGLSPDKKDAEYSQITVKASSIDKVKEVDKKIKALGYNTSSMESIREPMERETRQRQLMFAGLGAVSLFVAALGIMNTMIMAISERTREIGVMKSLGCFIGDIKKMFLFEAGTMGFFGGIIGSIFSFALSCVINFVSATSKGTEILDNEALMNVLFNSTDRISVINWELALGAVFFSALVGVLSGYWPAHKAAVKISALEAIKYD